LRFKEVCAFICLILAALPASAGDSLVIAMDGELVCEYTYEDLMSFPQTTIRTNTIWSDGVQEFEGPSLSAILYDAGLSDGQTLELKSLDHFSIQIQGYTVSRLYPIVAISHNGKRMNVRDNGPYRIIYPYDLDKSLRTETVFAQSVRMLVEINVLE